MLNLHLEQLRWNSLILIELSEEYFHCLELYVVSSVNGSRGELIISCSAKFLVGK